MTFLVSKRRGNEVTEQEAFDLLNMLGRLAKVETLDGATQARLQVPKSVVVWFAMYDARRDPVKVWNISIHLQAALITRRTLAITITLT